MATRDNQFDTRLLIHRGRQVSVGMIILVTTIAFGIHIREGMTNGFPWFVVGLPLCLLGLLFLLVPPVEEWEYKAWQSLPQRVEQQSSGK